DGDGVDEARVLADATDAAAIVFDDDHVALLRNEDPHRVFELRLIGWPAVAFRALQGARERRDRAAAGIDAPDAVMLRVGDEDRTVGRDGHAGRRIERCRGRGTAVADATTRDRMDVRYVLRARPEGDERSRDDDSYDDASGKQFHGPSCPSAARPGRLPVSAAV